MNGASSRPAVLLACVFLAGLAVGARGQDTTKHPFTAKEGTAVPIRRPMDDPAVEELDAAIDGYLREAFDQRRFTGVVLIAMDGKPLVRRAYGFADWTTRVRNTPETSFLLFSNTKSFTAAAILMLQDRGLLSVKDPVGKHLADCPPEWDAVTIHHLLSHTSGIEIDNLWSWIINHFPAIREDPAKPVPPYERKPLVTAPGAAYQYSNGGYILLSQVIARASGRDYESFLRDNIFGPIGMTSSGCDHDRPVPGRARGHDLSSKEAVITEQPTHGIPGAGNVYSTVDDLLRWDEALYGDKLLSRAAREAMFTPHYRSPRGGYGYGWVVRTAPDGRTHYQHGGSGAGFVSHMMRRPRDHVFLVVLANLEYAEEFKLGPGCLERVDAWLARRASQGQP
jgi:CubicO group peptidase (beta-lactamase class C family)